jgi:hypothetical protein
MTSIRFPLFRRNRLMVKSASAAVLLFSGAACVRSPEFAKDQSYYKPESPYYDRNKEKTPTETIEAMGQPKKKILIFDFWNDTPVKSGELGSFTSSEFRRGFATSQRLIVPKDVKSMLSTEDFITGEKVKVAQLIREGRRLGVSVIVIGRLNRAIFRQKGDEIGVFRQKQSLAGVDLELKVFDVNAGKEVASMGRSAEASNETNVVAEDRSLESREYREELLKLAIRNAVTGLVPDVMRVVEKMVWQGRVAKVTGKRVIVNAGKSAGMIAGDILKVLSPGDDVYDPNTGAFLGRSPGQLKGTLEVIDFIGTDAAVGELHTGGNFQEGDLVQLY